MSTAAESSCRVCGAVSARVFSQPVLGREIAYFDCPRCGYIQTETPYWLDEAYADAINDLDTGIMWRNQLNSTRVVLTLASLGGLRGRVLDYAGGYGLLVRLLRDAGIEARWADKYCQNLVARGFEADDGKYELVTAFEVFEHLELPLQELSAMLDRAPSVLISTELVPGAQTPSPRWWYFGPEHGQHIGFFRPSTLVHLAASLGCHVRTDGRSLHLFSRRPIPRSWLALQRHSRIASLVVKRRLRSKLMTDFDELRRQRGVVVPERHAVSEHSR